MKNLFILLTLSLTLGTAAAKWSINCCDNMDEERYGNTGPCWCGD